MPVARSFAATAAAIGDAGGPAIYCGYSMGGRLCLRLALDRPDLVRPARARERDTRDRGRGRTRRRALRATKQLAADVERDGVDAFLDRWLAQPMFAVGAGGRARRSTNRRDLSPGYLAHCLRVLGTGPMEPVWVASASCACRCSLVTGTADAKFDEIGARSRAIAGSAHERWLEAGTRCRSNSPARSPNSWAASAI